MKNVPDMYTNTHVHAGMHCNHGLEFLEMKKYSKHQGVWGVV